MFAVAVSFAASLASANLSQASTVVDWGGDYVTSRQAFRSTFRTHAVREWGNDALTDDRFAGFDYSDTNVLNPTSNYSGTSGTFYGGFELWRLGNTSNGANHDWMGVFNNGTTDFFGWRDTNGSNRRQYGMVFWKKEDFLNGQDMEAGLRLDETSSFGVSEQNICNNCGVSYRFVIEDSGQFYLSSNGYTNDGKVLTGTELMDTVTWAAFDPATNLQITPGVNSGASSLTYNIASSFFSDITSVGFYVEKANTDDAPDPRFEINGFEVSLATAAVPEVSTFALSGIGILLVGLCWLRGARWR